MIVVSRNLNSERIIVNKTRSHLEACEQEPYTGADKLDRIAS